MSCIEQNLKKESGTQRINVFPDESGSTILSMQYDIPFHAGNSEQIKMILKATDWVEIQIPETNPHVVNLAVSNYSASLGVHFITHKSDPKKEVNVIYWGGDKMTEDL